MAPTTPLHWHKPIHPTRIIRKRATCDGPQAKLGSHPHSRIFQIVHKHGCVVEDQFGPPSAIQIHLVLSG
jgi:hypothetical protein